jgi:hypothetical protein
MATEQMKQLKELLQSPAVRKRIRSARTEAAAIKAVQSIGAKEGYRFGTTWVKELFQDIKLARTPFRLSERDLVNVAGRGSVGNTAPMLSHSDSCGGGHKGCC